MRDLLNFRRGAALCFGALSFAAVATVAATPASATGSYSPYNESASTALARYVRSLASDPRDFNALIGAGRAALELGDAQAAAGFFARADDSNPNSPLPQVGMGAVAAATGNATSALAYFQRARQLGAATTLLACSRGLAYDLLGQQAQAQADYRLALTGADRDEAARRLALSLAISGDRAAALATLSPLMARRDPAAARTRAFVLALTGDANGAMAAINSAMPGSSGQLSPFLARLPALAAGDKAAAVNLGIFPETGTAFASASRSRSSAVTAPIQGDRLAGIDQLLSNANGGVQAQVQVQAGAPSAYQPWTPAQPAAPIAASYTPPAQTNVETLAFSPRRIWLQIASGARAGALPGQFERLKRANRDLFDGIPGYVVAAGDKARLIIGPFKNSVDAETFASDLTSANIAAFPWRNSETDRIVPVVSE
ncbi:MAG: hypothetical protein ABIW33_05470 [Sphingomicrobium sp.]